MPLPPHALPPYNLDTDKPTVAVTHVYHNADPIPQGSCTGFGSPCAQAGYALETKCRLGKSIIFDTVGKLGWGVDVRRHIIRDVIHKVLEIAYVEWEDGREVPVARAELDCTVSLCRERLTRMLMAPPQECQRWEFGNFKKNDNRRQDDNNLLL